SKIETELDWITGWTWDDTEDSLAVFSEEGHRGKLSAGIHCQSHIGLRFAGQGLAKIPADPATLDVAAGGNLIQTARRPDEVRQEIGTKNTRIIGRVRKSLSKGGASSPQRGEKGGPIIDGVVIVRFRVEIGAQNVGLAGRQSD